MINKIMYTCDIAPISGDDRLTTFPVVRPQLFKWYEDSTRCFWTVNEVSIIEDRQHYQKLNSGERKFVDYVLAFFAASDKIVNINLAERFKKDIPILEVSYFYDFQMMMENTHAHMYSLLLEEIIPSANDRDRLLDGVRTLPMIARLSEYMYSIINSEGPFAERLLKFACVEGIFFTGCFCAIYWLQNRGLMPALGHSNELIARDEALHTMFALALYTMIAPDKKITNAQVYKILDEAVDLASNFMREAIPENLPGMNADLMIIYIKLQADNIATLIDVVAPYGATSEFKFMEQINLTNRTNFFERRVSEYAQREPEATTTEYDSDIDF